MLFLLLSSNYEEFKKNESLWKKLEEDIFERDTKLSKIIFPKKWKRRYLDWIKDIEETAFRKNLRYSNSEIHIRIQHPGLLFFFLLVNKHPEAFLMGYRFLRNNPKTFYLDTIAVKSSSKGIGSIILKYMIKWAMIQKFDYILLNTELKNEKGFHLKRFYENFGFKVLIKKKTTLMMRLNLNSF